MIVIRRFSGSAAVVLTDVWLGRARAVARAQIYTPVSAEGDGDRDVGGRGWGHLREGMGTSAGEELRRLQPARFGTQLRSQLRDAVLAAITGHYISS